MDEPLIVQVVKDIQSDNTVFDMDILPKMKELCQKSFVNFWMNKDGSPRTVEEMKAVIQALGLPFVMALFLKHGATQDYIEAVDKSWTHLTPPYSIEELAVP